MPPSPAMRSSPRREPKEENHKRGHSLESGILFREKDDDLALFNEVQTKERDNFLLQSNDDFEDLFSTRLRYFSDHTIGISAASRGESSELLNADGDKNDYDWLLTPPDTPLFPSLDEETPPVTVGPRGRPRSQSISISRSSTMEKSYRSSRGSASPNRLSPSPRSARSTSLSRSRPSSASQSSPPPNLRHSTPSRRSSPSASKPSTSIPRSSTPNSRRMSTGSSGNVAPSRVRGTSPVKTSRGNSSSPKIKAWQSNIPGFSLEAPPNLRTSLADRPASYVRGSSPASRNGSKSSRQSMSPTPSRSISSSHSHDRDHFSTHSKGSIASSGDDDVDSLQSIPVSTPSAPRNMGSFQNSRAQGFSKKSSRIVSSSSAPKRSFDMAIRQMDHNKAPQNMFRPLLSSVPTSTFYSGKAVTTQGTMVSRNSSLMRSVGHDTEEIEENEENANNMPMLAAITDEGDQVFAYGKEEPLNEDVTNRRDDASFASQSGPHLVVVTQSVKSESCNLQDPGGAIIAASDLVGEGDSAFGDDIGDTAICLVCGCSFDAIDLTEQTSKLCPDCKSLEVSSAATTLLTAMPPGENSSEVSSQLLEHESSDTIRPSLALTESSEVSMGRVGIDHHGVDLKEDQQLNCESDASVLLENSLAGPQVEKVGMSLSNHPEVCDSCINDETSGGGMSSNHAQLLGDYSNSKLEVPEGAGVSLLLRKSNSDKGHVVQGRSFASSSLTCDDLFSVRDSTNSLRSSIGQGSISTSSSTDLSSMRHMENRSQYQQSGQRAEIDNYRDDMHSKDKHSLSSFSGASSHAFQTSSLTASSHEESSEVSAVSVEKDAEEGGSEQLEQSSTSENREGNMICGPENERSNRKALENSSNGRSFHPDDTFDPPASCTKGETLIDDSSTAVDVDLSSALPEACTVSLSNSCADRIDIEVQNERIMDTMPDMRIESGQLSSPAPESDSASQISRSSIDEIQEPSVLNDDLRVTVDESAPSKHPPDIREEATVMLEDQGGMVARSLTLEEATDAILFCSSIVHNPAYEAANIAIERETSVSVEVARPSVTIVGKSNVDRKDPRGKTTSKRTPKAQKLKKQAERERKPPASKPEVEDKIEVSRARIVGAPNKDDSIAPPKLESKCNCTIM